MLLENEEPLAQQSCLYESSSSTSEYDMSSGKSSSDAFLPLKTMELEAVMDPSTGQKYNH